MMMDLSLEPTIVLPTDIFPNANDAEENPIPDTTLSVHNATWFLELLEKVNMEELSPEEQAKMNESKLRVKQKHRTAILFQDDVNFVLHTEHKLDLDTNSANSRRTGSMNPRAVLVREACKHVIKAYQLSIMHAPLRSCVWSALMYRAEYYLKACGFKDVKIIENNHGNREALLNVQGHQVTRSNFTKIARHFCDSS